MNKARYPSQKLVKQFVAFMREQRIKSLDLGDIKIELEPTKRKKKLPKGEPQVDRLPVLTEEQQKQEEEINLFWSAG